jgi:hypothetical protein
MIKFMMGAIVVKIMIFIVSVFFCYEDDTYVPHCTPEWKNYIICHWFSRLENLERIWPIRTLLAQMEFESFYLHEGLSLSIDTLDHIRYLD